MKLPSEVEMQLLALVAFQELSGREVAKKFQKEEGRAISYGTLYTTFRRLKEADWVTARDDEDMDGRVRYFRITASGKRALDAARQHHAGLARFGISGAKVRPA